MKIFEDEWGRGMLDKAYDGPNGKRGRFALAAVALFIIVPLFLVAFQYYLRFLGWVFSLLGAI